MKGVIFKIMESTVIEQFGEDAWDNALEKAGVDGIYTSLGSYEDSEVLAILDALPDTTGEQQSDRLRWFGRTSIPALQKNFPQFFEGHTLRSILPNLNHIIHPEVRKLYPGANPPVFELDDSQTITLTYRSSRKLCHLAEGFILGTAEIFGEEINVRQSNCMHHGCDHCDIRISWE